MIDKGNGYFQSMKESRGLKFLSLKGLSENLMDRDLIELYKNTKKINNKKEAIIMSDIAILFIHGFMGHPDEFEILKSFFTNLGYDTYSFILSGHQSGKIKNITKKDWEGDCIENIELLKSKGYKKVIIVGHSIGGILASMMAIRYEDYIGKLILFDAALEYLRMENGKIKILDSLKQILIVLSDKNSRKHFSQLKLCSLSSIKEFYSLIIENGKDILKVKCPILFLHGINDYTVPIERIKVIYDKIENENKEFIAIENGSHWLFSSELDNKIYKKIEKFLLNSDKE